ncbi:hypothetical protein PF008_g12288 [Phytophthora fragariae]|uniref:Uncharacterized protein n=1 Tax=Phytophthora fragariae TaxID=53985 RepID=A0A6G0RPR6_9STRA|nr:hypothetical protein PF008_g12288 [Phytophthora fragariae]
MKNCTFVLLALDARISWLCLCPCPHMPLSSRANSNATVRGSTKRIGFVDT